MLLKCIDSAFYIYSILIFVDIFATWIPEFNESKIVHNVRVLTQPYLAFFRKFIPPFGVLDLSPMVAFFVLQWIKALIYYILF
jgi:YggT family protein